LVYQLVYPEVYWKMPRMMVEVDDRLLEEARRLSGVRTKKAAIEAALRELVRRRKSGELARLSGKVDIALTRRDLRIMREGR
jgi:Arc/MetJ family transcription regulator